MPHIAAFRGFRYDLGHVGALDGVVAPPGNAIDKDLQDELYKQHPSNVVRLILNRSELGDEPSARFDRAGRFFRNWQREGILQRDPDPAIYAYHQVFDFEGRTYTRRGFVCLARIENEESASTADAPPTSEVDEQLNLLRSSKASLRSALGLYSDPSDFAQQLLEETIVNVVPIEAKDHAGVIHRIWPITDIQIINDVASAIASQKTCIARGGDLLAAAAKYKKELGAELDPTHGANFAMVTYINSYDAGMSMFDSATNEDGDDFSVIPDEFFPNLLSGLVFHSHDA